MNRANRRNMNNTTAEHGMTTGDVIVPRTFKQKKEKFEEHYKK
jgi:hypothetical protein